MISNFSCWLSTEHVDLWSFRFFTVILLLSIIDFIVIIGNSLVILAVIIHPRLHTTTNYLMTSLAVSDLSIGLLVLPFSVSNQALLEHWLYGAVWCQIWLATDVWLCTASIYNLVAISFDRYMALSRPMKYKFIYCRRMGKILVSAAWTVSFLISLPPLLIPIISAETHPTISLNNTFDSRCICTPMNNDTIYIIYSACGSFFIPLFLILGLNLGIYRKARSASVTLKSGYKHMKPTSASNSTSKADESVLRVHRGGTAKARASIESETALLKTTLAGHLEVSLTSVMTAKNSDDFERRYSCNPNMDMNVGRRRSFSSNVTLNTNQFHSYQKLRLPIDVPRSESLVPGSSFPNELENEGKNDISDSQMRRILRRLSKTKTEGMNSNLRLFYRGDRQSPTPLLNQYRRQLRSVYGKSQEWNRRKVQQAETRVAKTVGIVVGCFIMCWLPFFLIYILQSYDFCTIKSGCIPELLFSFCFWMGYSNSALNPIIYALFSNDFRTAFTNILARLRFCSSSTHRNSSGNLMFDSDLQYPKVPIKLRALSKV